MSIVSALIASANAAATAPIATASWEARDYLALIAACTTIVALVLSYLFNLQTLKVSEANTEAGIWQKANEVEARAIETQLDGFYGPFIQLSGMNRLLSRDLRERQRNSETFLLLEKLFDRSWFDGLPKGEQAMVAEIVANAKMLREFIVANAKMLEVNILPYLSRLSAHYRMLELAYDQKLGEDPEPFVRRYVFPSQVDPVLSLEVTRLQERLAALRAAPGKAAAPMPLLEIPDNYALKDWVHPPRVDRAELTMRIE